MSPIQRFVQRAGWLLVLVTPFVGCEQRPTATVPLEPAQASDDLGPLAARAIAVSMAEDGVRKQILNDLRTSQYSEHKLVLQDYLRSVNGREILAAMKRAGVDAGNLNQMLQSARPIQFYVPVTAHRISWRGTPDILVVPNLAAPEPELGFTSAGATENLDLAKGLPSGIGALFVLQWAEPMFPRWAGPTSATETIQEAGESQVGGGTVEFDGGGRVVRLIDTPQGAVRPQLSHGGTSVPRGTYLQTLANFGVCDNITCDDLEIYFKARDTSENVFTSQLLTGIGQQETWFGLWKIHDNRAIDGNTIQVEVRESDGTSGDDHYRCPFDQTSCSSLWNPLLPHWDAFVVCDVDFQTGKCPIENFRRVNLSVEFTDRADPVLTTVTVAPAVGGGTVPCGGTVRFDATPRDQYGEVMTGKTATWSSSNPSIVTVASTGSVTAECAGLDGGGATISAAIDGVTATATVNVALPCIVRPNIDIENPGSWTPTPSNWPLWMTLSEGAPNDNSTVSKSLTGGGGPGFTVGLSDVRDPQTSAGHIIRARVGHSASSSGFLTVELMQGLSVIATVYQYELKGWFETFTYTLTAAEADRITNYQDLRLRITSTPYESGPVTAYWSWLEFEVKR